MIVKRAYKYRIYPNNSQKEMLEQHFGCSRYVYNYYLRKRIDCYMYHKEKLTYQDNAGDLVLLKKELPWLAEVNSQTLQASLKDLESAYIRFLKGITKFPNFKKKRSKQSFRVPQHFKINAHSITLPKIGKIKTRIDRPSGDKCYNITVSKTATGKYYTVITCDGYIPNPKFTGNVVGIDLGIRDYLVDSNGIRIENPKWLYQLLDKLQYLQQLLNNKTRGSRNYCKLKLKIAKLHEKIHNKRLDFLHKLSLRLVRENQTICCETLSIKKMLMKSDRHLARHIQNAAWGKFLTLLEYKGSWYGCRINKIEQYFPSSKRHYDCGFINDNLTLGHKEWTCPYCEGLVDRDYNAALNIYAAGTAVHSPLIREASSSREE